MSRPLFTAELRARIAKVARDNPDLTSKALGERFGFSRGPVQLLLAELGLARKKGPEALSLVSDQQAGHLKRLIAKRRGAA